MNKDWEEFETLCKIFGWNKPSNNKKSFCTFTCFDFYCTRILKLKVQYEKLENTHGYIYNLNKDFTFKMYMCPSKYCQRKRLLRFFLIIEKEHVKEYKELKTKIDVLKFFKENGFV